MDIISIIFTMPAFLCIVFAITSIVTIIMMYLKIASIQLLGIDNDDNDDDMNAEAQKYNFDKNKNKKRDRLNTCPCMLRSLDCLLIWERMECHCFTVNFNGSDNSDN